MCQVLDVSRSGYYDWKNRKPSKRQACRQKLLEQIRQTHLQSRQLYGSPRICRELQDQGVKVCENTVAKLMQESGIRSKTRKRFVMHTTDSNHAYPIAANRLDRRFDDWKLPNQAWCTDITCIWTDQGWLYLAAVMDLCSRKIVGWNMGDSLEATLCIEALKMALEHRSPGAGLIHHSDRGVQYACDAYQSLLEQNHLSCSMSRTGNCYDNAAMESFFGTFKRELVYQQKYFTKEQARQSIFEYIEVFYNRQRRHSTLGYVSPVEFEASLN
jgi:transposase InsO family protein